MLRKFDDKKYMFISANWCGGYGLAPIDTPDEYHAIPERRPGKEIEIDGIKGVEVLTHNCQHGYWWSEGVLAPDGTFYQRAG